MSRINLSENLFIGVQELQMFQNNCMNYLNIFGMLAKTFGLIENKDALSLSVNLIPLISVLDSNVSFIFLLSCWTF